MKVIWNMLQGFCMALADSVPGVSGGTIAFIMGFYDKFLISLNDLISGNQEERREAVIFLAKLGAGWVIGFSSSVLVLGSLFDSHIYELCSLFIGLSLFAVPLIVKEEWESIRGKYLYLGFTVLGIAIVAGITWLNQNSSGNTMNLDTLGIGNGIYVFVTAMIAISAMVLPGISGSTLLLVFGLYVPIMAAIRGFLHLEFRYIPVLFLFGMGILTGIFTSVKLLRAGLKKYRAQMIYLILGLILGSLYSIVMGPATLDVPQETMTFANFHPFFFLLGGVILGALQLLKTCARYAKGE